MIQINLLPNVKNDYIKAQRKKRLVVLSAITVSSISIGIVLLLVTIVYGAQKYQLSSLEKDINSNSAKLQKIDGLDKILTIQNQLNSLTALHQGKPVTTRVFDYITKIVPTDIQISKLVVNFQESTMEISGTAKSLESVNKFVDTLKFTDYTTSENQETKKAFSEVVLTAYSRNEKDASYTINLKFDPAIFSSDTKTVTLIVPKITSTRSQTESPEALFKEQTP